MKKKITITILIAALLCIAVVFSACTDNNAADKKRIEECKSIALMTVGANVKDVEYSTVTAQNDGSFVVKIEIDGINYDVTINADHTVKSVKINDHVVDKDDVPQSPFDSTQYIGKESAKEIAFTDAGVTLGEVAKLEVEFDFDDGKYMYEVSFRVGATKYEYDIDATTGAIHKKDVGNKTVISNAPNGVEFIGVENATQIAVGNALLGATNFTAEDAKVMKTKLEFEKGAYVYEIEFVLGDNFYEYEINAVTGVIIKTEIELLEKEDDDSPLPDTDYIAKDEALRIALGLAGVDGYTELEIKLEVEHGVVVYEVEFKAKGNEYEYEIDAKTGKVLDYKVEKDD